MNGLLLKEAPEPIVLLQCYGGPKEPCNQVFHDRFEYQEHRKETHGVIYTYILEPEYHSKYDNTIYPAFFIERWVEIKDSQGRMEAPWPVPSRPVRRYLVSKQEEENIKNHKCFCGNRLPKSRRKYCSDECSSEWNYKKFTVWDLYRTGYLDEVAIRKNHRYVWICANCDKALESNRVEVDHIIAIAFGGHPWDYRNLQTLCYACHKEKTKSDVQILAWWKRDSDYDIGPIIPDNQLLLEKFLVIQ